MSQQPVWFDVNGSFGKPSSGGAEFPSLIDRLTHMNRLGVSCALVRNVDSFQNNALAGNDALLEAIRGTPGAAGRIFPALAVSSLIDYEKGGMERFEQQVKSMPCRALQFANVFGGQTLMRLEPVIRRIRAVKPFIILKHDQASAADILEFTATFPDIHLVLTEIMWGSCVMVFDLMRQRRNIMVDISWLHTFNTIELLVARYGADRVVFGMGLKSHNGAAIGALARANITTAQRQKIAHGNLDRLTGLKTKARALPEWSVNTLWPRFLAGKSLGVDVVDAHGHLGPSGGYVLSEQEERVQLRAGLRDMDKIGIRTLILSGMQALTGGAVEGNDKIEPLLRAHAGRLYGYLVFNPFYADELVSKFDDYFKRPAYVGFKTQCNYWRVPITDKRFSPMWAYANRHQLPVLCHTWGGSPYSTPALFKDLVKRYPEVSFILGHSGGGDHGRAEAETLAQKHSNVYLEWCGSFCASVCWEETLKQVNLRQVLFGTDAMLHDFNWELARLLSLDITDKTLLPILGGNMRRILSRRV